MQKKMKNIILAVVIIVGFCIVRDFLIKSLIGTVATGVTGAPASVGGLSLSLVRQTVKISDFRMYNPKGFPKDILLDMPRMAAALDAGMLLKGKLHLRQLDIDIKELGMAKNKEGKLNVDSLTIAAKKQPAQKAAKKPAKQIDIQIDSLSLAMGRVVNKDYSVEGPPVIKVYDINLQKNYKNITSVQQLAALIVTEPLKAAGIKGLEVYGAAMLTGVAILPVAAAITFGGKDFARETLGVSFDKAYDGVAKAIKAAGALHKEDRAAGTMSGEVNGAQVYVKLKKLSGASTEVTISARKFGLPQPAVASGLLYRMKEDAR